MKTLAEEINANCIKNDTAKNTSDQPPKDNGLAQKIGNGLAVNNGNKPDSAKFENGKVDLAHSEISVVENSEEETGFLENLNTNKIKNNNNNNNNKNKAKPKVRNRGNNNNDTNKLRNHRNSLHASRHQMTNGNSNDNSKVASSDVDVATSPLAKEEEETVYQNLDKIYKLDIFARTAFPLFYVVYTVAYFIFYFGSSEK